MQIMMIIASWSLIEQAHELSGLLAQPMQLGANDMYKSDYTNYAFGDVIENHFTNYVSFSGYLSYPLSVHIYFLIF